MEVERRRYQNYLLCSGIAVILFGVWDIVKGFAFCISNWGTWILEQPEETQQLLNKPWIRIVIIFIIGIFSLIPLMFHYWLGKGAISESHGKRLKRPYVGVAVIWAIIYSINLPLLLIHSFSSGKGDAVTVDSVIIDLSFIIILSEMVYAALKVRKLTKQSEQKGA